MTRTAVYRIWRGDELLYVGASYNPWTRFGAHLSTKDWGKSATRMDVQWFDSRDEAMKAERIAIAAEKPSFNIEDAIGNIARKASGPCGPLASFIAQSGMTQKEFAESIGICFTALSRILDGKRRPTKRCAKLIEELSSGAVPVSMWSFKTPKSQDPSIISAVRSAFIRGDDLSEIANQAGVSVSTVSNIINRLRLRRTKPVSAREIELRRLADLGLSKTEAAKKMGIHQPSVCNYAAKWGIKFRDGRRSKGGTVTEARANLIRDLAAQGMTVTEAAKEIGITQPEVSKIKKQFGIEFTARFRRSAGATQ